MNANTAKCVVVSLFLAAAAFFPASAQQAASATVSVKNRSFHPAEIHVPANVPIDLRVKNLDSTAMEFESDTLHAEKVVNGNSEVVIRLKPMAPGRYEFYDDYHQDSTGVLLVR